MRQAGQKPTRRAVLAGAVAALARPAEAAPPAPAAPAPKPAPVSACVDVHCHAFCSADLPIVGFVAHQIPGLTEISRFLTRWPEIVARAVLRAVATLPNAIAPTGDAELASLRALAARPGPPVAPIPPLPPGAVDDLLASAARSLPFTLGDAQRQVITRTLETLYVAAHPRAAIAATMAHTFPAVSLFTPSLVDYDAWSDDRPPTPLWQQVLIQEQIARLSVAGRVGRPDARVHPFVAYDPRRQAESGAGDGPRQGPARATEPHAGSTAIDLVRYAVQSAGFLGVKLYPPVGFAPLDNPTLQPGLPLAAALDRALVLLYELCESSEVPILTHTSASNEYGLGLRRLANPARWAPVLQRFPALRLDLGHFGGEVPAWTDEAIALIESYPNVYADLSNSPLVYDDAYAERLRGLLPGLLARHPRLRRRLMYGSDWWLSALDPLADRAIDRFRAVLSPVLTPDASADLMGRNALRFLGFLDEQDAPRPGAAARRLRAFYGAAPRPPWLV
ncbi:MAG TPA: amidohydrolase family protein [Polyangia bacterium]|nr:amidohydrolase family protein [Polyangia bacterium]